MATGASSPHLDLRRSPGERASLLLGQMTVPEKAHQLVSCIYRTDNATWATEQLQPVPPTMPDDQGSVLVAPSTLKME
jgi:hypothetical protein